MLIIKKIVKKTLLKMGFSIKKKIPYKIGSLKKHNARIDALTPKFIEIGDDFVAAPGAVVLSHDASPFLHTGKYRIEMTIIGDKVFLGANSIVLPGVKIGNHVIVGAGAVVTKDIPNGVVVAGNPAKILCTIDEYFKKCQEKGCLYKAPEEFDIMKFDGRPTKESIERFQDDIIEKRISGT